MDKTICQRRQHHCAAHGCIRECTGAAGRGELVAGGVLGVGNGDQRALGGVNGDGSCGSIGAFRAVNSYGISGFIAGNGFLGNGVGNTLAGFQLIPSVRPLVQGVQRNCANRGYNRCVGDFRALFLFVVSMVTPLGKEAFT